MVGILGFPDWSSVLSEAMVWWWWGGRGRWGGVKWAYTILDESVAWWGAHGVRLCASPWLEFRGTRILGCLGASTLPWLDGPCGVVGSPGESWKHTSLTGGCSVVGILGCGVPAHFPDWSSVVSKSMVWWRDECEMGSHYPGWRLWVCMGGKCKVWSAQDTSEKVLFQTPVELQEGVVNWFQLAEVGTQG